MKQFKAEWQDGDDRDEVNDFTIAHIMKQLNAFVDHVEGKLGEADLDPVRESLTTIYQRGVESERERIAQWAKQNARTKDTMMSDFPENHEWTVDYHELLEELT